MIRRKQVAATVKLIEVDDDGSFLDELMEQVFFIDKLIEIYLILRYVISYDYLSSVRAHRFQSNRVVIFFNPSQISAPEEQELLLTGNGGEAGLARCLRLEHIKVKRKSSSGDTEKHGTHTYVPAVVEKVDPVVVGTSDKEGITGFFCEVMSPGKSWLSSQLFIV